MFLGRDEDWSIGLFTGEGIDRLAPVDRVKNPVLSARQVSDIQADFVADPFLVPGEGVWHLFFEALNAGTRKGEIGLAQSPDGFQWRYRGVVLREPFHLSYPHVFRWMGEHYMTPESDLGGPVRLYKAQPFPTRWQLVGELLKGRGFLDPSPFFHDNRWWMFVGGGVGRNDTLRLFHTSVLTGPWDEHPASPLLQSNPHGARPAGRVWVRKDRIIRFGQEAHPYYGRGIRAFEVTELTPTAYREKEIPLSFSRGKEGGSGWNRDGMHHIDLQPLDGTRWLACVDGLRRGLRLGAGRWRLRL